jgi:hypothetical protein
MSRNGGSTFPARRPEDLRRTTLSVARGSVERGGGKPPAPRNRRGPSLARGPATPLDPCRPQPVAGDVTGS